MTPNHISSSSTPDQRPWRIPANEIEDLVIRELSSLLESNSRLDEVLNLQSATSEDRLKITQASAARARVLKDANPHVLRGFVVSVLERISVRSDAIDLEIHPYRLKAAILREDAEAQSGQGVSTMRSTSPLTAFE